MLISGIIPPSGVKLSCMAFTAPQEAAVVIVANRARQRDAEADLLALHVAGRRIDAEGRKRRVGLRLGPVGDGDAGDEQHHHRREDRPALPLVADHPAEGVGERRADGEDRQHLDEVGRAPSGSRKDAPSWR